jgi:hypothetical protein
MPLEMQAISQGNAPMHNVQTTRKRMDTFDSVRSCAIPCAAYAP